MEFKGVGSNRGSSPWKRGCQNTRVCTWKSTHTPTSYFFFFLPKTNVKAAGEMLLSPLSQKNTQISAFFRRDLCICGREQPSSIKKVSSLGPQPSAVFQSQPRAAVKGGLFPTFSEFSIRASEKTTGSSSVKCPQAEVKSSSLTAGLLSIVPTASWNAFILPCILWFKKQLIMLALLLSAVHGWTA